jgi:hypothetical protein
MVLLGRVCDGTYHLHPQCTIDSDSYSLKTMNDWTTNKLEEYYLYIITMEKLPRGFVEWLLKKVNCLTGR